MVIAQTPLDAIDWQRSLLFCAFGAVYLGGFQYLYQVQVFRRLFDVDAFTAQPEVADSQTAVRRTSAQKAAN